MQNIVNLSLICPKTFMTIGALGDRKSDNNTKNNNKNKNKNNFRGHWRPVSRSKKNAVNSWASCGPWESQEKHWWVLRCLGAPGWASDSKRRSGRPVRHNRASRSTLKATLASLAWSLLCMGPHEYLRSYQPTLDTLLWCNFSVGFVYVKA